jgi:threonine/homoserine/homoserine lactone efflux protein
MKFDYVGETTITFYNIKKYWLREGSRQTSVRTQSIFIDFFGTVLKKLCQWKLYICEIKYQEFKKSWAGKSPRPAQHWKSIYISVRQPILYFLIQNSKSILGASFGRENQYHNLMLSAIIHWVLVWLLLAIMVWPVFLALMSVTLTQGVKKAYWFMSGNALSDMSIALLVYNGIVIRWGKNSAGSDIIGVLGGCVFIIYGIYLFAKKETKKDIAIDTKSKSRHLRNIPTLVKGFVMNSLNPSIFIFWITILTQFIKRYHHPSNLDTKIFIVCVLLTFFATDIIKIHSANRLLEKITVKNMKTIHIIAWILLAWAWVFIAIRTILQR